MTYHFNVTGADRKMLVSKISKILGIEKKYLGVPTCAYQIGAFIVSKDGTLSGDEDAKSLIEQLAAEGFPVSTAEGNTLHCRRGREEFPLYPCSRG